MKAVVVNCSAPAYNLGALKLADWLRAQGHDVAQLRGADFRDVPLLFLGYDLVALSVVFSWDAPIARDIALAVRANSEVWCGGPGMSDLVRQPKDRPDQTRWWERETGIPGHYGLDPRFDYQRGDYRMIFAARGCDVGCWFCNVWRIEGKSYVLDRGFQPAPMLCDNNLSGMPVEYQEFIIARYRESGVPLRDANSGFEPRSFDEATLERWDPLLRKTDAAFRFAFDEQEERADVERTCRILSRGTPCRHGLHRQREAHAEGAPVKTWYVTFTDGSHGAASAMGEYDAKVIAEHFTGKTVAGEKFKPEAQPLPYPTRDMIWQYEHPVFGKTPAFCIRPEKCAGRTACPRSRACDD